MQELTAAGVEVISVATLRENAAYKSLAPVLKIMLEPVSTQAGKSVVVGAAGMP